MRFFSFLDKLFYALHLAVVAFLLGGWISPQTRLAHLIFILLTLASWHLLGPWLGKQGYCPLTDWHWRIKVALGQPAPHGAFIQSLAEKMIGRPLTRRTVDLAVESLTILLALLSLVLNMKGHL